MLEIDASEGTCRKLYHRLSSSSQPSLGRSALLSPNGSPGTHGPGGPIALTWPEVKMRAGGKSVAWRRDDALICTHSIAQFPTAPRHP